MYIYIYCFNIVGAPPIRDVQLPLPMMGRSTWLPVTHHVAVPNLGFMWDCCIVRRFHIITRYPLPELICQWSWDQMIILSKLGIAQFVDIDHHLHLLRLGTLTAVDFIPSSTVNGHCLLDLRSSRSQKKWENQLNSSLPIWPVLTHNGVLGTPRKENPWPALISYEDLWSMGQWWAV